MERILYRLSYPQNYIEKTSRYKRNGDIDKESMVYDVKALAEYLQIDTDIVETEDSLRFRFYFPQGFVLDDLGLPSFENILRSCDCMRLVKSREELIDGILELEYYLSNYN